MDQNLDHQKVGHQRDGGFPDVDTEKVSRTEHKTDEEVLYDMEENRSLMDTIRERLRKLIGHIWREDSPRRTITEGRMEVKENDWKT